MGTWGASLYSDDFALDLRTAVSAVSRLPFDGDRLVEILVTVERAAAQDPANEDHPTFWLVVADQLGRRGIDSPIARRRAIDILASASDEASLAARGMKAGDLRKRRGTLAELRARLAAPAGPRRGALLKKPQAFLMTPGELLIYPTSRGRCINSYYASKEKIPGWSQDGWGAFTIVERGRAFDFLAWYRPLMLARSWTNRPSAAELLSLPVEWILRRPGTCSSVHFARLELDRVAQLALDERKVRDALGDLRPGNYQAINDISIANELSTQPAGAAHAPVIKIHRAPIVITALETILSS